MNYVVTYDRSAWYPVPASFPTDEWPDLQHWKQGLIDEFEADMGTLDDDARAAVAELADAAVDRRSPLANEALILCPRALLEFGIASVYCGDDADLAELLGGEQAQTLEDLVTSGSTELAPVIQPFWSGTLGDGLRASVIVVDGEGVDRGAFVYAFRVEDVVVMTVVVADRIAGGAIVQDFADELVRGIRLEGTSPVGDETPVSVGSGAGDD